MSSTCTCGQSFKEAAPWSNANCFVIVTGASRGFGRAFCIQLLKELAEPRNALCPPALSLTFFLLGRDKNALCETESQIIASIPDNGLTSITVFFDMADLGNVENATLIRILRPIFDAITKHANYGQPQWNLLVNNAGSLGNVQIRADEHFSISDMEAYFRVNLFSQILLTNLFLKHTIPLQTATTVLSISSLAACKPFSHMMPYCVGKAARDMHLRCLAIDRPSVSSLVYAPGPLATSMYDELETKQGDPVTRALFKERREQGLVVQPIESARVCIRWLKRQRFSSEDGAILFPTRVCNMHQVDYLNLWKGQHLDYFEARDLEEAEFNRGGV